MKKFILTLALLCFTVTAHAAELTKVKIGQWGAENILLYLPLYVAMEEGYFKQNGVDASIVYTGNDDKTFAAVVSGDVDFGFADPVFTALAAEKGLQAKTVALILNNLGFSGYTDKADIPEIKNAADLAGLRISSFPQPSTTYTVLSELKKKTPQLKDTKIVEGGFGTAYAMLQSKQVDIALDFEPAVSIAEDKGARVIMNLADFMDRQAVTGLNVMQKTIDQRPETVQAVVTGLQQAITAMYQDRTVAYRTTDKLFPQLGGKIVHRAVDRMMKDAMYPESVIVRGDLWQRTLKMRLDSGELKKPQATSLAVDNRFAEKAGQK
jgi:NitT/TauT family transport system substrate-binding protein